MILRHTPISLNQQNIDDLSRMCSISELLIFDIETTGFNRTTDQLISVTVLYFDRNESPIISQWFVESIEDEQQMLIELKPYFDNKSIHMTYNGHSFDIPFLLCKYNYYNISVGLNKSKCYDLYRIAKKCLYLKSYKLKQIEIALNIHRDDEISGKDCIDYYKQYSLYREVKYADLILQHNFEDVLNLVALAKVFSLQSDLQINDSMIRSMTLDDCLYYLQPIEVKGQFIKLTLWSFNSKPDCYTGEPESVTPQCNYFSNGTSFQVNPIINQASSIVLNIPYYSKRIDETDIKCFDFSFKETPYFDLLEPQQIIFSYGPHIIYENILTVINGFFCLTRKNS